MPNFLQNGSGRSRYCIHSVYAKFPSKREWEITVLYSFSVCQISFKAEVGDHGTVFIQLCQISFKTGVGDHGTVFIQCMPNFLQNRSVLTLLSTTSSRPISLTTEMDTHSTVYNQFMPNFLHDGSVNSRYCLHFFSRQMSFTTEV